MHVLIESAGKLRRDHGLNVFRSFYLDKMTQHSSKSFLFIDQNCSFSKSYYIGAREKHTDPGTIGNGVGLTYIGLMFLQSGRMGEHVPEALVVRNAPGRCGVCSQDWFDDVVYCLNSTCQVLWPCR